MTLIEGIGDEVTDFFIVVGIIFISWLAWCSTSISDQPLIRTVLILQQHTRNQLANLRSNQTASIVQNTNNVEVTSEQSQENDNNSNNQPGNSCPDSSSEATRSDDSPDSTATVGTPATSRTTENAESPTNSITPEQRVIEAMDLSNSDDVRPLQETQTQQHVAQDDPKDRNELSSNEQDKETTENKEEKISIKLKFMNDDQKLVTASPKEILGDFKRRHFQMELESRKLVRLVFKGHILQPDSLTLERCGLYNNCVVHCLVHQPRSTTSNQSQASVENSSTLYFNPQNIPPGSGLSTTQHDWALGKIMFGVLVLVLGLAWYTRYYYAQHFTATSTIVLYALTTIFVVSVWSQFFPDEDGIRNIE